MCMASTDGWKSLRARMHGGAQTVSSMVVPKIVRPPILDSDSDKQSNQGSIKDTPNRVVKSLFARKNGPRQLGSQAGINIPGIR